MQFTEIFNNASSVIIYRDNQTKEFYRGEDVYGEVLNAWNTMVCDAILMPAFGVSLDNYTREQMKEGDWLEFFFDGKCEFNELPFEKLLVRIEEGSGFNLIRYSSADGYSGRCFYLQLNDKNMSEMAKFIQNLPIFD